jgi:hypothetical protein
MFDVSGKGLMVTLNVHSAKFPEVSVARHTTVVVPELNTTPFRLEPVPVVAPVKV